MKTHLTSTERLGLVVSHDKALVGLLTGIAYGVGKEVYDYYIQNHICDAMDAIATIVGCIVGYILIQEFHAIII